MRMFMEVGKRVHAHCTGVGKALLSQLPDNAARAILARTGMPASTVHTITDPERLIGELSKIRERGYALDEEEQELGVRCIAVPISDAPGRFALSVSGPEGRMTPGLLERIVPFMHSVAQDIARSMSDGLA